jgi:hypothetical protein
MSQWMPCPTRIIGRRGGAIPPALGFVGWKAGDLCDPQHAGCVFGVGVSEDVQEQGSAVAPSHALHFPVEQGAS